jgi:hypothetical protein
VLAATMIFLLALLVQFLSAAAFGLSRAGGSAVRWWGGSLMVTSVIVAGAASAAACWVLVSLLDSLHPAPCAPLAPTSAAWLGLGLAVALIAVAACSVQAARLGARQQRAGVALAAVIGSEILAGALFIFVFAGLAGGTSC